MGLDFSKKTVWHLVFAAGFTLVAVLASAARAQTGAPQRTETEILRPSLLDSAAWLNRGMQNDTAQLRATKKTHGTDAARP